MLYFDISEINEEKNSNSALADIHGFFVFRDNFIETEKLVKEKDKEYLYEIEQAVFGKENGNSEIYDWVDIVLQSETPKYVKGVTYNGKTKNSRSIFPVIIFTFFLMIGILYTRRKVKRKRERKYGAAIK
ncbi:unknown [Clostridium sp. CAG:510]|nr:unknown [Clostridium sp. CAG:510]